MDYGHSSKHYNLIVISFSKQFELILENTTNKNNFIARLDRDNGATTFFTIEKSEEITSEISENAINAFWFGLVVRHI